MDESVDRLVRSRRMAGVEPARKNCVRCVQGCGSGE
jgi:hypothetical protein